MITEQDIEANRRRRIAPEHRPKPLCRKRTGSPCKSISSNAAALQHHPARRPRRHRGVRKAS